MTLPSIVNSKGYQLSDRKYYRRVSYMDETGQETDFYPSSVQDIDTKPPKIIIFSPKQGHVSEEGLVNIEVKTDPGCFVTINNYPVPIKEDRKFYRSVVLVREGANKITIISRDCARNKFQIERVLYLSHK